MNVDKQFQHHKGKKIESRHQYNLRTSECVPHYGN